MFSYNLGEPCNCGLMYSMFEGSNRLELEKGIEHEHFLLHIWLTFTVLIEVLDAHARQERTLGWFLICIIV